MSVKSLDNHNLLPTKTYRTEDAPSNAVPAGFKKLHNDGGGDCLFHCIAQARGEEQGNFMHYRTCVAEYYRSNNAALERAFEWCKGRLKHGDTEIPINSTDEYVQWMSQQGVWADIPEMEALCELFRLRLTIHPAYGPVEHYGPEDGEEFHLWFTGDHYEYLDRPRASRFMSRYRTFQTACRFNTDTNEALTLAKNSLR